MKKIGPTHMSGAEYKSSFKRKTSVVVAMIGIEAVGGFFLNRTYTASGEGLPQPAAIERMAEQSPAKLAAMSMAGKIYEIYQHIPQHMQHKVRNANGVIRGYSVEIDADIAPDLQKTTPPGQGKYIATVAYSSDTLSLDSVQTVSIADGIQSHDSVGNSVTVGEFYAAKRGDKWVVSAQSGSSKYIEAFPENPANEDTNVTRLETAVTFGGTILEAAAAGKPIAPIPLAEYLCSTVSQCQRVIVVIFT